ncbi:hypothetical protein ACH427_23860 [Streptomyces sp. NPDC020379]|uniref:hypothetical protein n=1 Tax=Streptomyces sp. NPDC020379 TaxID=3365071 RepID=UPI0037A4C170
MAELPGEHSRELIRPYTGEVAQVHVPKQGFTTEFAAVIDSGKGSFLRQRRRRAGILPW